MEQLQRKMLNYLQNLDFDYYEKHFGYNRWETVKAHVLDSYYGSSTTSGRMSFSPQGVKLEKGNEEKFIPVKDLKKLFENEEVCEQTKLFI